MDEDVLIVGGGIAGLGLCGFLADRGIEATVLEQATAWERVGWGIGLWGNGLAALDAIGAGERTRERGTVPESFSIRDRSGDELASVDLPDDIFLAIHRADLHAALREAVPADRVRTGTTVTAVEETGDGVTVTLADGTKVGADAVVGADGIGSTVREEVFDDWRVEDRSTVTWSFWTPEELDMGLDGAMVSRWLPGTEIFAGEVGGRGLVNVAHRLAPGETPDGPALDRLRALAEEGGGWLPGAIEGLEPEEVFFDRNREVRTENVCDSRVALIGDAAHAMHPISGMGASLALEDAYVMAEELASDAGIEEDFSCYEDRRKDRIGSIRRQAHWEEWLTFTESRVLSWLRDTIVRWTPAARWFLGREVSRFESWSLDELEG